MPNEKIKHTVSGYDVKPDGSVDTRSGYTRTTTATVHWYPDREVLLEVDSSGDDLKFIDSKGESIGEPFGSLAIPLDRAEINRLIKALRRARDAAYGRDE
jgi:hypothetical protein